MAANILGMEKLVHGVWAAVIHSNGSRRWRWTLYRRGKKGAMVLHSMGHARTRARSRAAVKALLKVYGDG